MAEPAIARQAADALASLTGIDRHDVAVVPGSGWSAAVGGLGERVSTVPASDVPGFRVPSVPGHSSDVVSLRAPTGKRILVLGARHHFYESRDANAVAHPVRVAEASGCGIVILTNGCGSIRRDIAPGSVVAIADHINLTGASPLVGPAFVDLTDVYSPRLRALAHEVDPSLTEGVYVQFPGPQYETPAEIRMAATMGATLVGMSTALEAIAAREAGLEVLGLSLVTNLAAGVSDRPIGHDEVLATGREAEPRLSQLLNDIVVRL